MKFLEDLRKALFNSNDIPVVYPVDQPKKKFKPYLNKFINETIHNRDEEKLFESIMKMDYEQLQDMRNDFNTECTIDNTYKLTSDFRITAKTGMRRADQLRKKGEFCPPAPKQSVGDCFEQFMMGWIMTDEFWKRWNGNKIGPK